MSWINHRITLLFATFIAISLISVATPSRAEGVGNLEERVHALESKLNNSHEGNHLPDLAKKIAEHVTLGGAIEVEGFALEDDDTMGGDSSDITLSKVELVVGAHINKFVEGHIVLVWEEDSSHDLIVEEGIIAITIPIPKHAVRTDIHRRQALSTLRGL